MAILTILEYPDPRLKRVGKRVDVIDSRIEKIIEDMFETHYAQDNCAALAATQLDIDEAPAITVIDFSEQRNDPVCLINPVLSEPEGQTNEPEGCMSVRNVSVYEKVKRAQKIRVSALDRYGNVLDFVADGFLAKCIQHEVDHLNGTLFIDHLSRLKRSRIDTKYKKQVNLL